MAQLQRMVSGVPQDLTPTELQSLRAVLAGGSIAKLGRGINLGGLFEAPWDGANGTAFSRALEHGRRVVDAGFDFARIPVRWTSHMSSDASGIIDPVFLAAVMALVDQLLAAGLTVVLNMHHYRQLDGEAPNNSGGQGDPTNVAAGDVKPRALAGWRQVAAAFKTRGPALLFEAYNEAYGIQDETELSLPATRWSAFLPALVAAIREGDPDREIVIGGSNYNNVDGLNWMVWPGTGGPFVATYHNYLPTSHTHQGVGGRPTGVLLSAAGRAENRASHQSAALFALAKGVRIFAGEIGCINLAADQVASVALQRFEAERAGLGWCVWHDCADNAGSFSLWDANFNWRPGMRDALFGTGEPAGIPAMPANILTLPTNQAWAQWAGAQQPTVAADGTITWPTVAARSAVAANIAPPAALAAGQVYQFSHIGVGACRYTLGVRKKADPGAVYDLSGGFAYPGQSRTFTIPAPLGGDDPINTWTLCLQAESPLTGAGTCRPFICRVS